MKKIKITIEGMHCGACAGNVERGLRKVAGIKEVSVSTMTHKGIIQAEESVKPEEIVSAVKNVGYKVVKVE